jgi:hypothetical protein
MLALNPSPLFEHYFKIFGFDLFFEILTSDDDRIPYKDKRLILEEIESIGTPYSPDAH